MFTKEQIEELLKPWGSSLTERPLPTRNNFAYEERDREKAWGMANSWQDEHCGYMSDVDVCTDFICHQSDVIEMLAHALSFANKMQRRDIPLIASGSSYKDRWCSACLEKIHEGDKFCKHCGQAISWEGILKNGR